MSSSGTHSAFRPGRLLRNPHLQSFLASTKLRRPFLAAGRVESRSARCQLDCGAGVRLEGFHAGHQESRGIAVLIHGWEGSARSTYVLSTAARLFSAGYDVFRLNLRDHGDSHSLNPGLFHSCRLNEVVGAVHAVAARFVSRPLFLVGFSLGGNFVLRVALRAHGAGIPVAHVVAVCPVIDPAGVLGRLERAPMYERHLLTKWRRSLRRKQELFPDRYDFSAWLRLKGIRETTRHMVENHSDFGTLERYLDGYSIAGARLADLAVPGTIIAAADDPILPAADLRAARLSAALRVELHEHGGHCGFFDGSGLRSWVDARVESILAGVE